MRAVCRSLSPCLLVSLSLLLLIPAGCQFVWLGSRLLPPATIQPRYSGMVGKSVAVMVWAEKGVRIDWPALQSDLATLTQNKMEEARKGKEKKVLVGTTFPVQPASVVRYQM